MISFNEIICIGLGSVIGIALGKFIFILIIELLDL